jgi:hypothetical protein
MLADVTSCCGVILGCEDAHLKISGWSDRAVRFPARFQFRVRPRSLGTSRERRAQPHDRRGRPMPGDILFREDAIARFNAGASQESEGSGPIDGKLGCQRGRGLSRQVPPQEPGSLRIGQSSLFLADRRDGWMGRSVTPLTRENAAQTRHDVGVGRATQQVHCRC